MSNKTLITLFIALSICSAAVMADTPKGWYMKGDSSYESGVDNSIYLSSPQSFYLRSKTARSSDQFGELFQSFSAGKYAGKRVKLTGFVKGNLTDSIEFGIVAWRGSRWVMAGDESFNFWQTYKKWTQLTTVIDVPINSNKISIFIRMINKGEVWLDDIKLEIVDKSTPLLNLHGDFIESNRTITNLP